MTDRIDNAFVRNHFMWDTMSDVDWAIVRQSIASANRVLSNPSQFPKASFDVLEELVLECEIFMLQAPIAQWA